MGIIDSNVNPYGTHAGYDNQANFDKVLAALQPFGFEDASWHNDTCPSVALFEDDETGQMRVKMYVDFLDRSERDSPEMDQFHVYAGEDVTVYVGEDVEAAINAALKAKG